MNGEGSPGGARVSVSWVVGRAKDARLGDFRSTLDGRTVTKAGATGVGGDSR